MTVLRAIQHPSASLGALDRLRAADHLGVGIRTLDYLAKAGEVRSVKIGRKRVFRIADLEEFLASRLEKKK